MLPGDAPGRGPPPGRGAPGSGCLRPRNRPLDRLRRGERVVADARCARRRLGARAPGRAGDREWGRGVRVRRGAGAAAAGAAARPRRVPRAAAGAGGGSGRVRPAWARAPSPARAAFAARPSWRARRCRRPWPCPRRALLPPNDSRSRRATGASTVEDADLTNSPCSLSRARTSLLVTPSSLANSCTRALPATSLLSRGDSGGRAAPRV